MVYFHPDLGKFWKVLNGMIGDKKGLEWKMLVFYGHLFRFGMLYREKSGNPGRFHHSQTL
jgi:hypothetical protein